MVGSPLFELEPYAVITNWITMTYIGEDETLLQFDRFGSHSVSLLFKLSWTTDKKKFLLN
ncbi:MAG: hypothetical protein CH6_0509 [Candidatus Kapaibacterium sp.]|nr:MAG: hypothetical protein CH6_0509 [Candidatus Kapabacteria bacterium]